MKNINPKFFIWAILVVSILVWAMVLWFKGIEVSGAWGAVKQLPTVISIDLLVYFVFVKWGWKMRIFQNWMVPFPCLEGTWEGTIQTTWKNPQDSEVSADLIPIILVIRQSFIHINCVMYSKETISKSYSADFLIDSETSLKKITYTYTSKPKAIFRDRSPIHDGTAILEIITSPERSLRGEYWNSRKSTGDIILKFRSKELLQDFPSS